MKKKVLAVFLALVMLIGMIPMTALSAAAKDTGEALAPTGLDPNNYKGPVRLYGGFGYLKGEDARVYRPALLRA